MGNEIAKVVLSVLSMLPSEVVVGIAVVIALLIAGYENKRDADRKAAEASKCRPTRTTNNKDNNNGQPRQ